MNETLFDTESTMTDTDGTCRFYAELNAMLRADGMVNEPVGLPEESRWFALVAA